MKSRLFYTTLMLSLPCCMDLHAMGLGEMTVHSYLNQPFDADIDLIDVGSTPLAEVQASLASENDFERAGLEPAHVLGLLNFRVEKNATGRPIIKVFSLERLSEPYLQLLLDLTWSKGQIYRDYTILLDPPEYQLVLQPHPLEPAVSASKPVSNPIDTTPSARDTTETPALETHSHLTYGPILPHESIWHIAHRYKGNDATIQQMILAIVGTNPSAFAEGNLNGLNVGAHLTIPSHHAALSIPETLAGLEVRAHDQAWQSKQAITHVINPPYITKKPLNDNKEANTVLGYPAHVSILPALSTIPSITSAPFSRLLPINAPFLSAAQDISPLLSASRSNQTAQKTPSAAVIESMKESNALLTEQLHQLKIENQHLQQQIAERAADMDLLKKQMNLLLTRQGLAGQISQPLNSTETSSLWIWILLLLGFGTLGGGLYGWFWYRLPTKTPAEAPSQPNPAPVNNTTTLDTLLSLAQAYIDKRDIDATENALQEVMKYGTKAQQATAKNLLKTLKTQNETDK